MHLYIHVPFCRSKCLYCGFVSFLYDPDRAAAYVQAVCEEIGFWGRLFQRPETFSVYLGGGTPSLLSLDGLEAIVRAVRDHFSVAGDVECSLEANPDSCSSGYLENLQTLGVNRLSLGLQSLDDGILRFLGRRHSAEQGLQACSLAREAGFTNLSVDLLWSIPGQDVETWLNHLEVVHNFGIEHVSCYALSVEPGTELADMDRSTEMSWPSENEQVQMFLQGRQCLQDMGFEHYEVSNYARPGFQCLHNLGYWQSRDYLGVGPAAVSCIGSRRWKNPEDFLEYLRVPADEDRFFQAKALSLQEQGNESLMLGLRTRQGLCLETYSALTGGDLLRDSQDLLTELSNSHLIRLEQGRLRLTAKGMLVSDSLISCLFQEEGRERET